MRFRKDGPKRLRYTRRETSPVSRQGYLPGVSNFKEEREARRAGLTGKVTKHDPLALDQEAHGDVLRSRERASAEREGRVTSSRDTEREKEGGKEEEE